MSNAINPPPNDEPEQRAPSEPATVKLERNRLEALTDWFVAGVLGWLLYSNTLHGEVERGAALTGLLAIAGVGGMLKALGKGGSATVAMLHFAGKPAVKLAAGIASAAARNTMQLIVVAVLTLGACAALPKIIRTIDVIARDLCEVWAVENEAKLGISPAAFCASAENVRPFVDAAKMAKAAAGTEAAAALKRE